MLKPRTATLVMLGTLLLSGAIVAAWFTGQSTISMIFQQINAMQENPPMWVMAPMMVGHYLLFWTVLLMLGVFLITKIPLRPQPWTRVLVVSILLILTIRYLSWRSLSTLNLDTPLNGVFSLGSFFLELLTLVGSLIQLVLLLHVRDRRPEADERSRNVLNSSFAPTVDILIPTYSEPEFILRAAFSPDR